MEALIIVSFAAVIIILGYVIWLIKNSLKPEESKDEDTTIDPLATLKESVKEIKRDLGSFRSPMEKLQTFMAGSSQVGTFAEWRLAAIIDDFIPPDMYEKDWRPDDDSRKNVEFAIKLENELFLPIDSKNPYTDYTNYLGALKEGNKAAAEKYKKDIRAFVIREAKKITDYIQEGRTPNLAYMFIPSEDCLRLIFSMKHEATGRNLPEFIASQEKRVLIVGPNMLATELSLLLANQQRINIDKRADKVLARLNNVDNQFVLFKNNSSEVQSAAESLLRKIEAQTTRVNEMARAIKRMKAVSKEDENN